MRKNSSYSTNNKLITSLYKIRLFKKRWISMRLSLPRKDWIKRTSSKSMNLFAPGLHSLEKVLKERYQNLCWISSTNSKCKISDLFYNRWKQIHTSDSISPLVWNSVSSRWMLVAFSSVFLYLTEECLLHDALLSNSTICLRAKL